MKRNNINLVIFTFIAYFIGSNLSISAADYRYKDADIMVTTPSAAKGTVYIEPTNSSDNAKLVYRTKEPGARAQIKGSISTTKRNYAIKITATPKSGYVVDGLYHNNVKTEDSLKNGCPTIVDINVDTIGDPKTNPALKSNYSFNPQIIIRDAEVRFRLAKSKAINITKKGTLKTKLLATPNYQEIEDLTITGTLNVLDFMFLKELANKNLAYLDISNTDVKIIPADCFNGTNLYYIKLPKNLTKIGERAFYNCKCLKEFKIPSSIEELGLNYYKK